MRAARCVLAGCLLVAPTAVGAQEFHPVAPEQVDGRRLIAREANFTIEAPAERWAWTVATIPNGRMYACRRLSDNVSFAVIQRADGEERMTEELFQAFLGGALDALREEGFSIAATTRHDAAQPFPGSVHFRASLNEEIDSVNRLVGFAGARGDLYALTALVGNDADELLFRQFAQSFRLLRRTPAFPPLTLGLAIFAVCVLVAAIAWIVRARR